MPTSMHPGRSDRGLSFLPFAALLFAAVSAGPAFSQACPVPAPDPTPADFTIEAVVPKGFLKSPIEMSIAKDGRVFIVERWGNIIVHDPKTNLNKTAATLDVYIWSGAYDVGGVMSVAVAPGFPVDNWVYVYYVPKATWNGVATKEGGKMIYRLSRFRYVGESLDLASEQKLLDVPARWETHNGGSLKFGRNDDLYMTTGDNNSPFCSDQYSAMDERAGFEWCDDQGTTANTNDLRGKTLRIHPVEQKVGDLYYTIPKGNLFPEGTAKTRPEIYTMGHRNPYRLFPDPVTGRLFIGEFGPAAANTSDRGPGGADEFSITDSAANMGYPYFLKDNQAYCHWDYAASKCLPIKGQTDLKFNPARPVNTSKNNTGLEILPPAKPAAFWENDGSEPDPFPGIKGCGYGAGPVYHFNPSLDSKSKFPPWFDGKLVFFGIGASGWEVKIAELGVKDIQINKIVNPPWTTAGRFVFSGGMHDIEFGPHDGALYVLDYGPGFYANNASATLWKVAYKGNCNPPVSTAPLGAPAVRSRMLMLAKGATSFRVPAGSRRVRLLDMFGKEIWSGPTQGSETIRIPAALEGGARLLMARFE